MSFDAHPLITALLGALSGGFGLKILERILDRWYPTKKDAAAEEKERRDEIRALFADDFTRLEGYIKRLETEIAQLRLDNEATLKDVVSWRKMYWEQYEIALIARSEKAEADRTAARLELEIKRLLDLKEEK